MPALSKAQRRLFALALEYKRGKLKADEVSDEVKQLAKLSEKTLKDYASKPEKDLPDHVKEVISIALSEGLPYGHEFTDPKRREAAELNAIRRDQESLKINHHQKSITKRLCQVATFDEWLKKFKSLEEDTAQPASSLNTPGMGNTVPASYTSLGSGDTFDKLPLNYDVWLRIQKLKKRKAKKKNF